MYNMNNSNKVFWNKDYKFDLLDLFSITPKEVVELFFKELEKKSPDLENIRTFLESELVDVHTKDNVGRTPLHVATIRNSKAVAEFLISSGADLNARNEYGYTPLHSAAWGNSLDLAKLLISFGAKVNAKRNDGWTPLHQAAVNNSLAVAELLISSGAEVNAKNENGLTPLHRANSQEMKDLLQGVTI